MRRFSLLGAHRSARWQRRRPVSECIDLDQPWQAPHVSVSAVPLKIKRILAPLAIALEPSFDMNQTQSSQHDANIPEKPKRGFAIGLAKAKPWLKREGPF